MKKRILLWLGIFLVLFVAAGFFLPSDFAVERRQLIDAPPHIINRYLETPKLWNEWSAWSSKRDPSLVYTYSGPDVGQDAKQSWTSDKSGNGWLKITRSSPKTGINYEVGFDDQVTPYRGNILLQRPPRGQSGSLVAWTMLGSTEGNFFMRYFALKFDDWIGSEFEIGLKQLKTLAEKDAIDFKEAEAKAALEVKTSSVATSSVATSSTSSTAMTSTLTSTTP